MERTRWRRFIVSPILLALGVSLGTGCSSESSTAPANGVSQREGLPISTPQAEGIDQTDLNDLSSATP